MAGCRVAVQKWTQLSKYPALTAFCKKVHTAPAISHLFWILYEWGEAKNIVLLVKATQWAGVDKISDSRLLCCCMKLHLCYGNIPPLQGSERKASQITIVFSLHLYVCTHLPSWSSSSSLPSSCKQAIKSCHQSISVGAHAHKTPHCIEPPTGPCVHVCAWRLTNQRDESEEAQGRQVRCSPPHHDLPQLLVWTHRSLLQPRVRNVDTLVLEREGESWGVIHIKGH